MPTNDINAAVQFAMQKCWDEDVGYSQNTRYLNPNVDCSALVYYSLRAGGFTMPVSSPWDTSGMMGYLRQMGFTEYTYNSDFQLQHGDICVHRESDHGHATFIAENVLAYTANVYDYDGRDGRPTMNDYPSTTGIVSLAKVEAYSDRGHPQNGDQINNAGAHCEVFVHMFEGLARSYTWHVFRWGGAPGPTPTVDDSYYQSMLSLGFMSGLIEGMNYNKRRFNGWR